MIKKLCIILLSVCTVAPVMAQQYSSSDDASFAPKKGQWQVSMVMGSSQMFNNNTENYLLPIHLLRLQALIRKSQAMAETKRQLRLLQKNYIHFYFILWKR